MPSYRIRSLLFNCVPLALGAMLIGASFLFAEFSASSFVWPMFVWECIVDIALCSLLWGWLRSRACGRVHHFDSKSSDNSLNPLPCPEPCPSAAIQSTAAATINSSAAGDRGTRVTANLLEDRTLLRIELEATRLELQKQREEVARLREVMSLPATPTAVPNTTQMASGAAPTHFRVGPPLGQGSTCTVSLGLDLSTGGFFACKQMRCLDPAEEALFQQEVTKLSGLTHDNVVQTLGCTKGGYFFEELLFPGSLRRVLSDFGPLEEPLIQRYSRQLVIGAEFLHSRQVVHGDIKGENCLLDVSGRLKLIDFGGLVRSAKQTLGTPFWMAPEVLQGDRLTPAADVWAIGIVVIEMATGAPPDAALSEHALSDVQLIAKVRLKRATEGSPATPASLSTEGQRFCAQCLQMAPSARPTATQLLDHTWLQVSFGSSPKALKGSPELRVRQPKTPFSRVHRLGCHSQFNTSITGTATNDDCCGADDICVCITSLQLALLWLSRVREPHPIEYYLQLGTPDSPRRLEHQNHEGNQCIALPEPHALDRQSPNHPPISTKKKRCGCHPFDALPLGSAV